jgi:asparagine synthetase B (glutamine-hydrolysing)
VRPHALRDQLIAAVRPLPGREVALLLSGGVDSVSLGGAAVAAGKRVVAYTFDVQGQPSDDRRSARHACDILGWSHVQVTVPTATLADDLRTLARVGCRTPTAFMCTWPFLHLLPRVEEAVVLAGHGADVLYGLGAQAARRAHVQTDLAHLQAWRADLSAATCNTVPELQRLCADAGHTLACPYLAPAVMAWFAPYDFRTLHTPYEKYPTVAAFADVFRAVGRRPHLNLQIAAGVRTVFQALLDAPANTRRRRSLAAFLRDLGQGVAA